MSAVNFINIPTILAASIQCWLVFVCLVVSQTSGTAQLPQLIFNAENSLLSNTIYDVMQSSKGELWISSDKGVSIYNGYEFMHLGRAEGLPDNEIFNMFEDKGGRIWLASFNGKVAFHWQGDIYQLDDFCPELKANPIQSWIHNFMEDEDGRIWIIPDQGPVYIYDPISEKLEIKHLWEGVERLRNILVGKVANTIYALRTVEGIRKKLFLLKQHANYALVDTIEQDYIYKSALLNQQYIVLLGKKNQYANITVGALIGSASYKNFSLKELGKHSPVSIEIIDQTLFIGSRDGCFVYEWDEAQQKPIFQQQLLKGHVISTVTQDHEGTTWIGSLNKGLCRLTNTGIFKEVHRRYTYRLVKTGGQLFGCGMSEVSEIGDTVRFINLTSALGNSERVTDVELLERGRLLACAGTGFVEVKEDQIKPIGAFSGGYKDLHWWNGKLFVGHFFSLLEANFKRDEIDIRKLFRKRANTLEVFEEAIYIGNNAGLFRYDPATETGEHILQKNIGRVNHLSASTDALWIASAQYGLLKWQNGKTTRYFSKHSIQRVYPETAETIWAVANNALLYKSPTSTLTINLENTVIPGRLWDIAVIDTTIYIGTSSGLFKTSRQQLFEHANHPTLPLLVEQQIEIDQEVIPVLDQKVLKWNQNNLSIRYTGIAFHQAQAISYRYHLTEASLATSTKDWKITKSRALKFHNLIHGTYTLEIQASLNGKDWSPALSYQFDVQTPYFRTAWFWLLCIGTLLALISSIWRYQWRVSSRTMRIRHKMYESEQKALRAQMNPHFLFNVLNSIQQFFLKNEAIEGHRYLSKFAVLIRNVLNYSEKKYIPLHHEIQYLKNYMTLELLRVNLPIDFQIHYAEELPVEQLLVPSMIVQPLLENAVQHAFPKNYPNATIHLYYQLDGNALKVLLQDNGKGFDPSLLSAASSTQKPHGFQLVQERIKVLNQLQPETLKFKVESSNKGTTILLIINQDGIKQHERTA